MKLERPVPIDSDFVREAQRLVKPFCQQVRSESRAGVRPVKFKMERTRVARDKWRTSLIFALCGVALVFSSGAKLAKAQNKKNNCGHPPKILSQAKFSDEDRAKWKNKSVTGKVAIVISEEGDISQARVLAASPKEAREALRNAAKQMKFEARRGCGELQTEIHFSLGER
jgi:hypothetical protein